MKKTVLFGLILGLFCTFIPLHASTLDRPRLRMLPPPLSKSDVSSSIMAPMMTMNDAKTLSIGLKSDTDVLKVQALLNQLGYLSVTPDGNYGPKTAGAVTNFQTVNGLEGTGVVDSQTLALMTQGADSTQQKAALPPIYSLQIVGDYCVLTVSYPNTTNTSSYPLSGPNLCSMIASLPYIYFTPRMIPPNVVVPANATVIYQSGLTCTYFQPTATGWSTNAMSSVSSGQRCPTTAGGMPVHP